MKDLRDYTIARVNLGIAGSSLPTQPLLNLRLAQARARDAVHQALDFDSLSRQMRERGWHTLLLSSAARDRADYLRNPDKGRILAERTELPPQRPRPVVFTVGDGLSALSVERHAIPLLEMIFERLTFESTADNPIVLVKQARVAIGDPIGERLGAGLMAMLIGERPGLSSPDSLGVYITWRPMVGCTDAKRNCISNIHSEGLSYDAAAHKIVFLIREAQRLQLTGVALKDTSAMYVLPI